MIEPGDRILIAVSGGKDSSCLAWDLAQKRAWWDVPFEIVACHISTDLASAGFAAPQDDSWISTMMAAWQISYVHLEVPVADRLKPNRRMNCYWCSTQRRTELMRYAQANGFNKLALGHHMDDILETLLMNMLKKANLLPCPQ